MAIGDVLTIVGTEEDPHQAFAAPTGGGGGGQILGPYQVTYQDDVIYDDEGTNLGTVPDGAIVLRAWVVPTVAFHSDTNSVDHWMAIGIKYDGGTVYATVYPHAQGGGAGHEIQHNDGSSPTYRIAYADSTSFVTFEAYPGTGNWDAGEADIFLLVA